VKSRSVSEYRLSACRNTFQPWSVSAMTLRRRSCSEGLRDDCLAFECVEERDHRGAVDAQHGRGFLL
jgi:hypothetical protein